MATATRRGEHQRFVISGFARIIRPTICSSTVQSSQSSGRHRPKYLACPSLSFLAASALTSCVESLEGSRPAPIPWGEPAPERVLCA
jgi:hypothetical protein